MESISVLLWDIDGTILDFRAAEKNSLRQGFAAFGLGDCDDAMVARYSAINKAYWARLERGELDKKQALEGRFRDFLAGEGLRTDIVPAFNDSYQLNLGNTICFIDDAYELLLSLRGRVRQYGVTNGTRIAQKNKLRRSGLDRVFDGVFISDEIGFEKPMPGFFDFVLQRIAPAGKKEVMIIGDSLGSDILGGNNAGILCCWYNPEHEERPASLRIDYEIDDLRKIRTIL